MKHASMTVDKHYGGGSLTDQKLSKIFIKEDSIKIALKLFNSLLLNLKLKIFNQLSFLNCLLRNQLI